MTDKCDRCGKETKEFYSMGNMTKNPAQVCQNCHDYWHIHYIPILDKMNLGSEKWRKKWGELFANFLFSGKSREVVEFT